MSRIVTVKAEVLSSFQVKRDNLVSSITAVFLPIGPVGLSIPKYNLLCKRGNVPSLHITFSGAETYVCLRNPVEGGSAPEMGECMQQCTQVVQPVSLRVKFLVTLFQSTWCDNLIPGIAL
jgi:hypothetical protein